MNLRKVPAEDYVEEEHGPVFSFFSSLGTYILQIMSANVLFLVFNIPMAILSFIVAIYFLPQMNSLMIPQNFIAAMEKVGLVGNEVNNAVGNDAVYQLYYMIVLMIAMFLIGSLLFCFGPFQAGFSQIYRNIYRKDGVFFFHDFKEGMKNNMKQSLCAMAISIVTTLLIFFAIVFYGHLNSNVGNAIMVMFVFLFGVFILIQNMVYNMIVAIDLPLKKIYRNALFFFLLKFIPCVGLVIVELLMLVVIPVLLFSTTAFFGYAIAVLLYITFSFAFCHYLMAFFTGEMINKYILTKLAPSEEEDETEDEESEESSEELTDSTSDDGDESDD